MEAFPDSERRQERRFNRKGVVMNIHRVNSTYVPINNFDRYNLEDYFFS